MKRRKAAANNAVAFLTGLVEEEQSKPRWTKETNDIGNRKAIGQKKIQLKFKFLKRA